jgi:hypothetical protein
MLLSKYKNVIQLLLAFIFFFILIHFVYHKHIEFENLALGTQTSSLAASNENGNSIHCLRLNQSFIEQTDYHSDSIILLLGNSQSHSINQLNANQTTYVGLLNSKINFKNKILATSFPNANLQELYTVFSFWSEKFPIKTLVLPLFFDDFREDGIRDVFLPYIIDTHYQLKDSITPIVKKINTDLKTYWINTTKPDEIESNQDNAALKETVQEKVELKLNHFLDKHISIWNNRSNIRGSLFNYLYLTRNTVLGIKASTIRPIIKDRYDNNMDALSAILKLATLKNIKVLLYIPPIRSDVALPYKQEEYSVFKEQIQEVIERYNNIKFCNFESCVPGSLWGYKEATNLIDKREVDYMHFQFRGHQILADSIYKYISTF